MGLVAGEEVKGRVALEQGLQPELELAGESSGQGSGWLSSVFLPPTLPPQPAGPSPSLV